MTVLLLLFIATTLLGRRGVRVRRVAIAVHGHELAVGELQVVADCGGHGKRRALLLLVVIAASTAAAASIQYYWRRVGVVGGRRCRAEWHTCLLLRQCLALLCGGGGGGCSRCMIGVFERGEHLRATLLVVEHAPLALAQIAEQVAHVADLAHMVLYGQMKIDVHFGLFQNLSLQILLFWLLLLFYCFFQQFIATQYEILLRFYKPLSRLFRVAAAAAAAAGAATTTTTN